MLKLELSDGHKRVIAMEYRPIPGLSTKVTPGCKILLKGPIKVLNKVLFLEANNVKILDGELDTLLITNALENMLLKQLNRPMVPIPKLDYQGRTINSRFFWNNTSTNFQYCGSIEVY